MLLSPGQKVSNSDMHLLDMVSAEEIEINKNSKTDYNCDLCYV